jgi:uncharacterized membrane-anchored protein
MELISLRQLEHALAPWQSAYSNSKVVSTSITAVHLIALLFGGGLAIAADRGTFRALRAGSAERARQLSELHSTHRPVLIALAFLFVSGVLQAAADVKTFATAPAFYIKLGLVALLVVNGAVLTLTETALGRDAALADSTRSPLWSRLRASTYCSLALWTATLVAGVVLQNAT